MHVLSPSGERASLGDRRPQAEARAWPLPRLFRGGQARDGADARVPVATAPPRGGPRPSWYVRVRGGSTRGEPSHPTGSTGAAPPYTCGAEARLRSSRRSHVANPRRVTGRAHAPTAALQRPVITPGGRETAGLFGGRPGVGIGAPSMPNAPALNGPMRAGSGGVATDAIHQVLY